MIISQFAPLFVLSGVFRYTASFVARRRLLRAVHMKARLQWDFRAHSLCSFLWGFSVFCVHSLTYLIRSARFSRSSENRALMSNKNRHPGSHWHWLLHRLTRCHTSCFVNLIARCVINFQGQACTKITPKRKCVVLSKTLASAVNLNPLNVVLYTIAASALAKTCFMRNNKNWHFRYSNG